MATRCVLFSHNEWNECNEWLRVDSGCLSLLSLHNEWKEWLRVTGK